MTQKVFYWVIIEPEYAVQSATQYLKHYTMQYAIEHSVTNKAFKTKCSNRVCRNTVCGKTLFRNTECSIVT